MELDIAVRHKRPLMCIIISGGWTADPNHNKPGRDLGYTRYDKMAEACSDGASSPGWGSHRRALKSRWRGRGS
jgi:hypothetical protein